MNKNKMLKKLLYLQATKEEIKQSLTNKGVSLGDDTPFREYPTFIENLLGMDELEEHIQGKLSIIRALNNKFGLDILKEATYPEIVYAMNLIVIKDLQRSFKINSSLNTSGITFNPTINFRVNKIIPLQISAKVTNNLDVSNLNFTTNIN